MKILFLSRWYPCPPDNGAKIRVFNLIKCLSTRHEVALISFASERVAKEHLATMGGYCHCVHTAPYRPFRPGQLAGLKGFLSRRPRSIVATHSNELSKLIDRTTGRYPFDAVISSQIDMALYAADLLSNKPKIFEELELTSRYEHYIREGNPLRKMRRYLTWWKLTHYAAKLLQAFDACTVVSDRERELVRQVSPGCCPIGVVPNGVDIARHGDDLGAPEADTLVYAGALSYNANFDAVDFFIREVLPLIRAKRPRVKLYVTGKADIRLRGRLPRSNGVVFTGYLDDVRPKIANSWASVVPLRIGGGTRLKILESLALGTPVVATSKGAEGLDLIPGREILIADMPEDLANTILRLLQDAELRKTLSLNGRLAVRARYDWQDIGKRFVDFIETVTERHSAVCSFKA